MKYYNLKHYLIEMLKRLKNDSNKIQVEKEIQRLKDLQNGK